MRTNTSGSLCPATKSAQIIGDKWVLLILREMFLGSARFNDFQRAFPRMSPTILSRRLKQLEADGLIIRKSGAGHKSREYRLTRCGRELGPIIEHMATWGLRWARRRLSEEDLDTGSFMWDFHRTLGTAELPDGETVFCVRLSDVAELSTWWLIADGQTVDLCTDDPGKDVDVYVTGSLIALVEVWMGDKPVADAIADEAIVLVGQPYLTRTVSHWFPRSTMADIRPAERAG